MTEIFLVFALAIGLAWPLGHYLAAIMRGAPMHGDALFLRLERPLFALIGTSPARGMSWRGYAGAFLLSNAVLGMVVLAIFMTQAWLPLNPNGAPNMGWDLALHTMVSFLTNTNQQHYSGQAQLSFLAQMTGIVALQVVTPMMGLAVAVATLRGLFGGRDALARKAAGGDGSANTPRRIDSAGVAAGMGSAPSGSAGNSEAGKLRPGSLSAPDATVARADAGNVTSASSPTADSDAGAVAIGKGDGGKMDGGTVVADNVDVGNVDVGNYWADVIRPTLRFMLPLCLLWSVLLTSQGVPATLAGGPVAAPVDATAQMPQQKIPLGPVAPMVAIKQLGTNGGGWYGPNSAVPLENPTPLSNLLQTLALILVPMAVVVMVGSFTGRRRFAALVFGTMMTMSAVSAGFAVWSEGFAPASAQSAVMEGKEVRFGAVPSALWAALTTQTSNGSVNAMHDSLAPLTGLVTLSDMLINAIWGGIGCGLQQFLVYLLLAVFVAGLMTGRTPELFGRKIEAAEVRLLAVLVLLQPLLVLGFTAATLALPGLAGNSNPGFHAISQVFYEYTSAFANNGSGFEGLADATPWWNITTTIVLAAGRYPALILPLMIAALLARKRPAPESPGSLQIDTPTFALTLIAVMVILTLLQFMPVLVLGPVAEHLSLSAQ